MEEIVGTWHSFEKRNLLNSQARPWVDIEIFTFYPDGTGIVRLKSLFVRKIKLTWEKDIFGRYLIKARSGHELYSAIIDSDGYLYGAGLDDPRHPSTTLFRRQ